MTHTLNSREHIEFNAPVYNKYTVSMNLAFCKHPKKQFFTEGQEEFTEPVGPESVNECTQIEVDGLCDRVQPRKTLHLSHQSAE